MAHKHDVIDQDCCFCIDPAKDMAITCEGNVKGLKRGDHNSEIYSFSMPRYIEGHDMSLCNKVEIHCNNIRYDRSTRETTVNKRFAEAEGFGVDAEDGSTVTWTWQPTGDATQLDGKLAFCVRFACLDGAEITYQKFSGIFDAIPVGETIHNTEEMAKEYADVLEQWRQEILAETRAVLELNYKSSSGVTIGQQVVDLILAGGGSASLEGTEGFWAAVDAGISRVRLDAYGLFEIYMPATVVMANGKAVEVCANAITELPGSNTAVYDISIGIVRGSTYTRIWAKRSAPENSGSNQSPNGGTGLTATEKNLMLTLLKAVPYQTDVSTAMKSLEAIWNSGSSGGETPDIPDVTNYTVTYSLTSVTADNAPASVIEGGSLTVNLTPDANTVLGEVVVAMGGVDVTAAAYSNGKISIPSVTGDVVISATGIAADYTQVEYLESPASETHGGIATNYILAATDLVECTFEGGSNWAFPFGTCTNGGDIYCLTTRNDNVAGRTSFTRRGSGTYLNRNTADPNFINAGAKYRFVETAPGTAKLYDDDNTELVTLVDESVAEFRGTGSTIGLFAFFENGLARGNSSSNYLRIYSFKVTNAYGDKTLDLIPVLDKESVPCMYDKVSGEYFYNTNGETFIAGGAV